METENNVEENKKKNSKKLLLIIPVVIIVVLILAFIFGEKVPDVKESEAISITADEIAEKFLEDKSGMDKEFHNKVYEITGIVEDSNGQYSMTISTKSGEYKIYFDIDREKSNKIPELEKGDTVTMKGLYSQVLTDRIDFKNAIYVSSENSIDELEHNTSEYVDYLASKAKSDAETATDGEIQEAINWLKNNTENYFSGNENMENTMYYGELLEYKYKDTGNDLEKIGWQAFKTVKYVYRGVESVTDTSTHDNLMELKEMLENYKN